MGELGLEGLYLQAVHFSIRPWKERAKAACKYEPSSEQYPPAAPIPVIY